MVAAWARRVYTGAVLALLLAAVPAAAQPRIVGGQPASKPYPFAAFVELRYAGTGEVGYCGGSLIAARYVLTAGHCLEGSPSRIDVTVGSAHVDHDPSTPAEYQGVSAVRDPQFSIVDGQPADDAAVLTLPSPAPEAPVRLPRPSDATLWTPGTAGTAIGWGRCGSFELSCGGLPNDLREVAQPIQPDSACAAKFTYATGSMLCAGGEVGRDTCNGDSGGALVVDDHFGDPVLAGSTSFGSDTCGDGTPAVYTRVGGPAIDAWIRSVVPQVEIDADTAAPVAGQVATFTAVPSRPGGGGPFGGYDTLSWDLDGDGTFGEAAGQTQVQRTMADGVNTVSVRATDGAGDAETRTIHLRTVRRAALAFTTPAVTVREGQPAVLTIARVGTGAGTVAVTPQSGTARIGTDVHPAGAQTVSFGLGDSTRTVAFTTTDDRKPEPARTFRVALGGYTGDLIAGAPATATVTVLDDDPAVHLAVSKRVSHGRVAVTLRADRAGRFKLRTTAGGRLAARSAARTLERAGHLRLRLRAGHRARRALARHRRLKVRVAATFTPAAGGGHTVTVRRTVVLRGRR